MTMTKEQYAAAKARREARARESGFEVGDIVGPTKASARFHPLQFVVVQANPGITVPDE